MTPQPLESRIDSLEHRMTHLEQQIGPDDRDPSQVVPLRTEMRAEFSAVRAHLASLDAKAGTPAESLYRIDVIQGKPTASAELIETLNGVGPA